MFINLTENELLCLNNIYENYPIELVYFVIPNSLNMDGYNYFNENNIYRNEDKYFTNTYTYSELLTSDFFYSYFQDYEYMLIHQTDAYTIKNNIDYFINLGYDYYGAPWSQLGEYKNICGNGGFCLRRIDAMINFCQTHDVCNMGYEDYWICIQHRETNGMKICPYEIGLKFAYETIIKSDSLDDLPMGVHKLYAYHYDLWNKIINLKK